MTTEKKPVLNFWIDPDLLKRIEDFQFANRFKFRSEAAKWLLKWALDQNPELKEKEVKSETKPEVGK